MREFMKYDDVRVAAICDVYKPHLEKALAATQGKAKGYSDFRRVLDRKDLDAVVVAPPPALARFDDGAGVPGRQRRVLREAYVPHAPSRGGPW